MSKKKALEADDETQSLCKEDMQQKIEYLTNITCEKDRLIDSLLARNSVLEERLKNESVDVLETENEINACELAEQCKLNEIKNFYIKHLEAQSQGLLCKLRKDDYTSKTIIPKITLIQEALISFSKRAERNRDFEKLEEMKGTNAKVDENKLEQLENELADIKDEKEKILADKRARVRQMKSALKKSVDGFDDFLSKHLEDIMGQIKTYDEELGPLLVKIAEVEEVQVKKYREILEYRRVPEDTNLVEETKMDEGNPDFQ